MEGIGPAECTMERAILPVFLSFEWYVKVCLWRVLYDKLRNLKVSLLQSKEETLTFFEKRIQM